MAFPTDKLQMLLDNVLVEKWYIPVKLDEPLGVCLTAAISLAQKGIYNKENRIVFFKYMYIFFLSKGKLDTIPDCKRFIEDIVPEAFRKVRLIKILFCYSSFRYILVTNY